MDSPQKQKIFGHKKTIEALTDAARNDRLHHTLLFSGNAGIGKRLVANQLAGTFFCDKSMKETPFGGCGECHGCRTFAAENTPDFFQIDCSNKQTASTEAIRELLWSLRLRPFSGENRFLVFDNAHLLQGQAANVLLKSLEEPRPGTFFVLITSKPHLMLRTIHSRAQRWGFQQLTDSELSSALEQSLSEEIQKDLLSLSGGSLQAYHQLGDLGENLSTMITALERIAEGDEVSASELSSQLAKNKELLPQSLNTLQLIARHKLQTLNTACWANFLYELGELDYLLLKRNFAPLYLLQSLLLRLADKNQERFLVEESPLISDAV